MRLCIGLRVPLWLTVCPLQMVQNPAVSFSSRPSSPWYSSPRLWTGLSSLRNT